MSKKDFGNKDKVRTRLFRKFSRECEGLIVVTLLRPACGGAAMALQPESSLRFFAAAVAWAATISPDGPQPLCLTCDQEVNPRAPAALFEMRPYSGKSTVAVFSGVCQVCGRLDDETLIAKASKAY